ncbi:hypothetical protein EC957_004100 [Mortierella hygrophila]|uniref:UspA domain-containing protein n=1 Tax=Mortierella hygrophila TaxID=979708 RepID=A0A9P6FI13_9FUNG|nr:hypothetical protein EC957_004100 [Mortierella hygrophila]
MIISTPKIGDLSDDNTLTVANTLANALITADFSYSLPQKHHKKTPSNSTNSTTTTNTTNTTSNTSENGPQPRTPATPATLPKPSGYVSRVGFDTLGCDATSEYAFTLQSKTNGWSRSKHSRTFLVGTDLNDYSAHALHWVMENMVENGDEVVALRVVPVELRDSLSKTKIPSFQGQESAARVEATKIMDTIREKNTSNKQISIVVEYLVGNVRDTIQHMTRLYKPDMLVVGTRGRSSVKGFLLGSVSRYCLHHSTVPVIVVRPERKLNKSKNKAKGIFRRRSSVMETEQDYQPHSMHMSSSSFDLRRSSQSNGSNNSTLLGGQASLFPSATIHAGESFPGVRNSMGFSSQRNTRPLSSLFAPLSPPNSSPISTASSTTFALPPRPMGSPAPPPPDGNLKMKKSLTMDGSSNKGSSKGIFGRSTGGFLFPSKNSSSGGGGGIGGFMRGKKRHSHGDGGGDA